MPSTRLVPCMAYTVTLSLPGTIVSLSLSETVNSLCVNRNQSNGVLSATSADTQMTVRRISLKTSSSAPISPL